ncbi:NAD(P)-binding domain-containing protein [Sorangium sp. So ce260]|uniref:flavin-containing monooxygenase n=1 Tax=Sorangium sp. So ce260 TaxID=3133291 RepID=UPI003F61830C
MSDHEHKHAIIGAGLCGLGVARAFKRSGIPFDVFEADDDVGGNWYHGVYETVHIITSKRTTEYSDFPMPADYPDFPSAAQMLDYLRAYADHFGLREHIAFRTRVTRVAPRGDGRWEVTPSGPAGGAPRVYGGVVVCNGHHWDPRMPDIPGTFSGQLMHAKHYKRPEALAGKRVLVLGGGNSACDIAVEASRFGASSHISLRRGYWFLPKMMLGVPTVELLKPWMPRWFQRRFLKALVRLTVGRYDRYGLPHPDHEPFERHPTINSELLYHLRHGRITPHPDVRRLDGDAVEFVDGARERFDLIVAATGYHVSFPFLADGVISWKNGLPQLIDGIVPPSHKNLYVFGLGQPRYGAGPLVTAGADLLCTMVATQQQLKHPLGALLARMNHKPPHTLLQDPFQVLRSVRMSKRLLPRLPRLEPLLMRGA